MTTQFKLSGKPVKVDAEAGTPLPWVIRDEIGLTGTKFGCTRHRPKAWVHIADDNTIRLISARAEMGQGVDTSMPMPIAEELKVASRKIKVALAPAGKV